MKVLIVGCGAVGQVYALALWKAGVALGLLDQPAVTGRLKQARQQGGLPVFRLSNTRRKDPMPYRLKEYQVLAGVAESQRFDLDQIWFATPSQAYYSDRFRDFLRQAPLRRVVCFCPEGRRPEFSLEGMDDRVVFAGLPSCRGRAIWEVVAKHQRASFPACPPLSDRDPTQIAPRWRFVLSTNESCPPAQLKLDCVWEPDPQGRAPAPPRPRRDHRA